MCGSSWHFERSRVTAFGGGQFSQMPSSYEQMNIVASRPKKILCNRSPQMIIMTHRCSAHIITSSYHMQIYLQLSSHFGSAAICSFKSFVQKDSRFQSISEGLGVEMPQNFIMPSGLPTYKGFTWFSDFT